MVLAAVPDVIAELGLQEFACIGAMNGNYTQIIEIGKDKTTQRGSALPNGITEMNEIVGLKFSAGIGKKGFPSGFHAGPFALERVQILEEIQTIRYRRSTGVPVGAMV
jgi:hypothetical protein